MAAEECKAAFRICKHCLTKKPIKLFKTKTYICKACDSKRSVAWGKSHRDRKYATNAAWEKAHRESGRRRNARYRKRHHARLKRLRRIRYWAHREEHLEAARLYRLRDPEKWREYSRNKRRMHPEAVRSAVNKWAKSHREYMNDKDRRRRALKHHAAINDFTGAQWLELLFLSKYRCVYCKRKLRNLTRDHLTALANGGNHTVQNILPACKSCNSKKGVNGPLSPVQPFLFDMSAYRKEEYGLV